MQKPVSHLSCSLSELFSPGKLDVGSRWKPPTGNEDGEKLSGAPKRKFKSLDEVLQNENSPGKHITYHVPPGMTCFFYQRWPVSIPDQGWGVGAWGHDLQGPLPVKQAPTPQPFFCQKYFKLIVVNPDWIYTNTHLVKLMDTQVRYLKCFIWLLK